MTSGWLCDVVEDRVRCTNKKATAWDLEAPETGMTFRINLCGDHKTRIMVLGQVEAAIAGDDADLKVDAIAPADLPGIKDAVEEATCNCVSTATLYDIRSGNDLCPGCRHVAHNSQMSCGVSL